MSEEPLRRFVYDAFISYGRKNARSRQVVPLLQNALEKYVVPKKYTSVTANPSSRRLYVFRDESDMSLASDLQEEIKRKIEASRFLIVACSPQAVKSRWVSKEISFFLETHSLDGNEKIIPILVDGQEENAVPRELKRGGRSPIWADLRDSYRQQSRKELRDQLETAIRLVLQRLLAVKADRLAEEELRRKNKSRWQNIRRFVILAGLGLVLGSTTIGLLVKAQKKQAAVFLEKARIEEEQLQWDRAAAYFGLARTQHDSERARLGFLLNENRAVFVDSVVELDSEITEIQNINDLLFSSDGRVIAVPNRGNRKVMFWNRKQKVRTSGLSDCSPPYAFLNSDSSFLCANNCTIERLKLSADIPESYSHLCELRTIDIASAREALRSNSRFPTNHGCFCPTMNVVAVAGDDSTIHIVDVDSLEEIGVVTGSGGRIRELVCSSNAPLAASYHVDGKLLTVWNLESQSALRTLPVEERIEGLAFSWDGRRVAMTSGSEIRLVNIDDGKVWRTHQVAGKQIAHIASSPTDPIIVAVTTDKVAYFWNSRLNTEVGRTGDVASFAPVFSPSSRRVALRPASSPNRVYLWNLSALSERTQLVGHQATVLRLSYCPSGETLVSSDNEGRALFWNLSTGKNFYSTEMDAGHVLALSCARSNPIVAVASSSGSFRLLDYRQRRVIKEFDIQRKAIGPAVMALSPKGDSLAYADFSGVHLIDMVENVDTKLEEKRTFYKGIAFDSNGRRLVVADEQSISVWDVNTHRLVHKIKTSDSTRTFAASASGAFVAIDDQQDVIHLWDLANRAEMHQLVGHRSRVSSLAFSNDERLLVSSSDDGTLRFWETRSGVEIAVRRAVVASKPGAGTNSSVLFVRNDKYIALTEGRYIRLVNINTTERPADALRRLLNRMSLRLIDGSRIDN